ncbi:unnamed protein product [Peniophora sp. CBMAI 1063]|nr:unnamed protein product [Peniophora sp. CBMAI 1063]
MTSQPNARTFTLVKKLDNDTTQLKPALDDRVVDPALNGGSAPASPPVQGALSLQVSLENASGGTISAQYELLDDWDALMKHLGSESTTILVITRVQEHSQARLEGATDSTAESYDIGSGAALGGKTDERGDTAAKYEPAGGTHDAVYGDNSDTSAYYS